MRRLFILTVVALAVAAGAPVAAGADTGQHAAILITSYDQFTALGSTTGCGCVTAGNGTAASPYVIGPLVIRAPSSSGGYAIEVDNSLGGLNNIFFTITGIAAAYSGVPASDPVIWLRDVSGTAVSNISISNVSANEDGIGVELDSSNYINLDQLSFNKMNGTGLFINGSSYVTVSNSKFKATSDSAPLHTADGLYALNSSYLSIGGVPACPGNQICNSFDYDSGFGVYLENTHDSTIDRASANADDTAGYVLDGSWHVMLSNSGAGSDGPICFSSGGTRTHTGYESDLQGNLMLIGGSHDNTFLNDQLAAPIGGYSIGSGGNTDSNGKGVFFDPCTKSYLEVGAPEAQMSGGRTWPNSGGNTFPNTCYRTTDIEGLPALPCK